MHRHRSGTALRAGLFAITLLAAALASAAAPLGAQQPAVPPDFTAIVREKIPAVVAITTRRLVEEPAWATPDGLPFGDLFRRFRGAEPRMQQPRTSLGSGFVISADGHIVTNSHVVENASEIRVVFPDRATAAARLVGRDPVTDIAVLKIDPRPGLAVVAWGDSDRMEPGAWTIAIGSPFGLGGTVTVGVLSARSRDIYASPYDDFLQTDASINQGNSGGPLFNASGEVIGVNTAIFSPVGANIGIGFAVPSRAARAAADQLIRTGRVERGYIGLRLQEITPAIARALGRADAKGALVASVERASPAEKAGIETGDVITRIGDQAVENPRDLARAVAGMKPGTEAPLTVLRGEDRREITVAIGQRSEDGADETGAVPAPETTPDAGDRRLGLVLAPIDEQARQRLGVDVTGVLVQEVMPNSPAAENGIRPGDVIVSANSRAVGRASDVAEEWATARRENKPILLRVRREGQYLFVAIPT